MVAGGVGALIAGCLSLRDPEPQRYYVLEPGYETNPKRSANPRSATLLVAPTSASPFYETPQMVYSRAAGERAYYQLSSWTERPAQRIAFLLVSRLEHAHLFKTVAYAASGVQGNLLLNTHLAAFYHDAAMPPGRAVVSIIAELIDTAQFNVIARQAFERFEPAPTYDAAGAVAAFNRATGAILDAVTAWAEASAPR